MTGRTFWKVFSSNRVVQFFASIDNLKLDKTVCKKVTLLRLKTQANPCDSHFDYVC